MSQRQPRVPVRWGFVLMMGVVVAALGWALLHFGGSAVADNPEYEKGAVAWIKRHLLP